MVSPTPSDWGSLRHRAAIRRSDLSQPARQCLNDNVIGHQTSVLDYGCGRGQDVERLKQMGLRADGWDPFFAPDNPLAEHDAISLRWCSATKLGVRDRACICSSVVATARVLTRY